MADVASLADAAEHPADAAPSEADGSADHEASLEAAEAPGDIAADPTQTPEATQTPEVTEVPTVEVWRLQRQQRHANPRQNRPRGAGRDGAAPNRAPGEGRPDQRRQGGQAAAGETRERPRGDRPDGNRRGGPGEARPEGGRPQRRERFEPGRVRPERRDEPRAAPRDEPRPQRRERAPDPDSPFAKLAALKAQLESGNDRKR